MNEFEKKIEESWEEYRVKKAKELCPNIMLLGASGVGKSSLINRIFGVNVATVSSVKPETVGYDNIYYGKKYGLSVNIIDTAGYEMNQANTYYEEVKKSIVNGVDGQPVHLVWYCMSIAKKKIEDMDTSILKLLLQEESIRKRLCVVFTKCDEDDEQSTIANALREVLHNEVNRGIHSFETSIYPDLPLDLDKLIQWSANSIDEEDLKNKFIASQFVDLDAKKKEANKIISTAATAAAAAGAIPLPFADSVVLVPIQVKMITNIIDIYGVTNLASISASVVGDIVISQLGRTAAKTLISMIPVVGTALNIATATINASVAATITSAMGYAISEICYEQVKKYLKGEKVVWDKIFDENIIKEYIKNFRKEN